MSILDTTGAIDTSRERTPAPSGSTDEQNEDSSSPEESITRDGNWWDPFNTKRFLYFCIGTSLATAITFITLYSRSRLEQTGGEVLPTPVVLKISVKNYTEDTFFNRMYISGKDTTIEENKKSETVDIRWRTNRGTDQNDFWYLEVSPIRESGKDCPVSRDGTFGFFDDVDSFNDASTSSCNLYDFRLVIFNNLTGEFSHGATVHFHGLTPPSNQDGVPFISNANIHPQNLQAYRFNQFTYPGLHWMHAHTGKGEIQRMFECSPFFRHTFNIFLYTIPSLMRSIQDFNRHTGLQLQSFCNTRSIILMRMVSKQKTTWWSCWRRASFIPNVPTLPTGTPKNAMKLQNQQIHHFLGNWYSLLIGEKSLLFIPQMIL